MSAQTSSSPSPSASLTRSVRIEGYRGLGSFEMADLGRINLLVGRNNCGKTSVLEALHLLSGGGNPWPLFEICQRRGERISPKLGGYDFSHLFRGHRLDAGAKFTVEAGVEDSTRSVCFEIAEPNDEEREQVRRQIVGIGNIDVSLIVRVSAEPGPPPMRAIPFVGRGGLDMPYIDRRQIPDKIRGGGTTRYVAAESLTGEEVVKLWSGVALTAEEETVLEALRLLEPGLERIASLGETSAFEATRGGFIVKLRNHVDPIPIGSLGGGIWRTLAMVVTVTQCRGGMLLIDEIDTGLHYTVMEDLWRLVISVATALDVQVFATTHSYDCVKSLAAICRSGNVADNAVTIQRIEVGRRKAVAFTEPEIRAAADLQIEVR